MPNAKYYCTSQLSLPIISDYTLIASEEIIMTVYSTAVLINDKLAKTHILSQYEQ